jgi:hypothetical protein
MLLTGIHCLTGICVREQVRIFKFKLNLLCIRFLRILYAYALNEEHLLKKRFMPVRTFRVKNHFINVDATLYRNFVLKVSEKLHCHSEICCPIYLRA